MINLFNQSIDNLIFYFLIFVNRIDDKMVFDVDEVLGISDGGQYSRKNWGLRMPQARWPITSTAYDLNRAYEAVIGTVERKRGRDSEVTAQILSWKSSIIIDKYIDTHLDSSVSS